MTPSFVKVMFSLIRFFR